MIRPVNFSFNEQTAVNNTFQVAGEDSAVQQKAQKEFTDFVNVLQTNGIDVTIVNDTPEPHTPDSIFPNNWLSSHTNGTIFLYPMFAENRRLERKNGVLEALSDKFIINETIDLSAYEKEALFLEGTGSMVLDREYKIAYACLSPRTDKKLLEEVCQKLEYRPVVFHAWDGNHQLIYHTNVMMCVADQYAVICLESITDEKEQKEVMAAITATGKKMIEISMHQVNHFAGNMLQVENNKGERFLVMSSQAYYSLTDGQIEAIASFNKIIHSDLKTIEANGGGSARCMIAEIFLERK